MTRYSQVLVHSTVVNSRLYGWVWEAVLGFFAVSATFFWLFSGFMAGFGVLFGEFMRFQLLFSCSFSAFWLDWGAVWEISAISATFFCFFPDFGLGFGVLFCGFLRFQLHKTRLLCYQPMAIVHYDNLKIQHFLNKRT